VRSRRATTRTDFERTDLAPLESLAAPLCRRGAAAAPRTAIAWIAPPRPANGDDFGRSVTRCKRPLDATSPRSMVDACAKSLTCLDAGLRTSTSPVRRQMTSNGLIWRSDA